MGFEPMTHKPEVDDAVLVKQLNLLVTYLAGSDEGEAAELVSRAIAALSRPAEPAQGEVPDCNCAFENWQHNNGCAMFEHVKAQGEVTEAMIEAGFNVLWAAEADESPGDYKRTVERIYRAMQSAALSRPAGPA